MERSRIKVDEFPCKKLGYCPYGPLVEDFPVEELRSEKGCPVYGHVCPVFSAAEAVDVPDLTSTLRGVEVQPGPRLQNNKGG